MRHVGAKFIEPIFGRYFPFCQIPNFALVYLPGKKVGNKENIRARPNKNKKLPKRIFCCFDNEKLIFFRGVLVLVFFFLAINGTVVFKTKIQISTRKVSNNKKQIP